MNEEMGYFIFYIPDEAGHVDFDMAHSCADPWPGDVWDQRCMLWFAQGAVIDSVLAHTNAGRRTKVVVDQWPWEKAPWLKYSV